MIRLTLTIDGSRTDWSNPDAPVTVSIPYTPTATELANPESIVVWYNRRRGECRNDTKRALRPVDRQGNLQHNPFIVFAAAWNKVSFNDVASGAWYGKAVDFIAARGITDGTGNGKYSPDAKLTRGEFLVLMMRAYGIAPDINPSEKLRRRRQYVLHKLSGGGKTPGISEGAGNNMFAPDKDITRQEMFYPAVQHPRGHWAAAAGRCRQDSLRLYRCRTDRFLGAGRNGPAGQNRNRWRQLWKAHAA